MLSRKWCQFLIWLGSDFILTLLGRNSFLRGTVHIYLLFLCVYGILVKFALYTTKDLVLVAHWLGPSCLTIFVATLFISWLVIVFLMLDLAFHQFYYLVLLMWIFTHSCFCFKDAFSIITVYGDVKLFYFLEIGTL